VVRAAQNVFWWPYVPVCTKGSVECGVDYIGG
jgi:hypothetical protein